VSYHDKLIRNAKITGTMLGLEDHGFLIFYLYLDYGSGGGCQGAGGYILGGSHSDNGKGEHFDAAPWVGDAIVRIMQVVGVEKWEDLKGKHVRAEASYEKVFRIGNLLADEWVDLTQLDKLRPSCPDKKRETVRA
jgi:hypothetical protein